MTMKHNGDIVIVVAVMNKNAPILCLHLPMWGGYLFVVFNVIG